MTAGSKFIREKFELFVAKTPPSTDPSYTLTVTGAVI